MTKRRDRTNLIILLAALLAAAVLGFYLPTKRTDTGSTLPPKQQIDLHQRKKAQRQQFAPDT